MVLITFFGQKHENLYVHIHVCVCKILSFLNFIFLYYFIYYIFFDIFILLHVFIFFIAFLHFIRKKKNFR